MKTSNAASSIRAWAFIESSAALWVLFLATGFALLTLVPNSTIVCAIRYPSVPFGDAHATAALFLYQHRLELCHVELYRQTLSVAETQESASYRCPAADSASAQ